jgi:hypothetical protein
MWCNQISVVSFQTQPKHNKNEHSKS